MFSGTSQTQTETIEGKWQVYRCLDSKRLGEEMNYTQTLTPGAGTPCEGGVADEARVALPAPAARVARGTAARDLA